MAAVCALDLVFVSCDSISSNSFQHKICPLRFVVIATIFLELKRMKGGGVLYTAPRFQSTPKKARAVLKVNKDLLKCMHPSSYFQYFLFFVLLGGCWGLIEFCADSTPPVKIRNKITANSKIILKISYYQPGGERTSRNGPFPARDTFTPNEMAPPIRCKPVTRFRNFTKAIQ